MKEFLIWLLLAATLAHARELTRQKRQPAAGNPTCQPLPAPSHATITCGPGFPFYSCTATCDAGYTFPSGLTSELRECDQMYDQWFVPPGKDIPDCVTGPAMCHYGGHTYQDGQNFTSTDGCNSCVCTSTIYNGRRVTCTQNVCVNILASCRLAGRTYHSGEIFHSPDGCNACICTDGTVDCTARACK